MICRRLVVRISGHRGQHMQRSFGRLLGGVALGAIALGLGSYAPAQAFSFMPGDIVIDTVTGSALDSASPMTLMQFSLNASGTVATAAGSLTLPQVQNGANSAISGEYGSASEGFLTQSVDGHYLTIIGYGVNANTFNTNSAALPFGTSALGQTTSLTSTTVQTVPRVVALIGANGGVDTSTALTGVFNTNNPRSAVTVDGSSFYVSGQAGTTKGPPAFIDSTQGVFYAQKGATTATVIDNSTDTRALAISNTLTGNNTLYVSRDFNPSSAVPCLGGSNNDCTNIGSYGGPPTSATPSTRLIPTNAASTSGTPPVTGAIDLTARLGNGVNDVKKGSQTNRVGSFVYLSPEQFFFANATTVYVADSGQPKNGNVDKAAEGEGGLQKWTLNTQTGQWTLQYDLVNGLNLLNNDQASSPTAPGVTGLFGLTGVVLPDGTVELFATSYGLNELSPGYLYEITDSLSCTADPHVLNSCSNTESFTTLYSTVGTNVSIRGVAFAPTGESPLTTPLPAAWTLMLVGLAGFGMFASRRQRQFSAPANA